MRFWRGLVGFPTPYAGTEFWALTLHVAQKDRALLASFEKCAERLTDW